MFDFWGVAQLVLNKAFKGIGEEMQILLFFYCICGTPSQDPNTGDIVRVGET